MGSGGSDRSLLDRLNALKPSTVKLESSTRQVYPLESASTLDSSAGPVSKEDALADRLKTLRNQTETRASTGTAADGYRSDQASPAPTTPTQGRGVDAPQHAIYGTTSPSGPPGNAVDDMDALLDTDDQTLEELLADLGSDEQWLEEVAAEVSRTKEEEHRRVTALLDEIGREPLGSGNAVPPTDEDGSDDSEGDVMMRDADDVLAQAVDEAEWEKANMPRDEIKATATSEIRKSEGTGTADPFNLPTVPSELQDQPNLPETSQEDTDFAADIASRMAALKGLGGTERSLPSAPTSNVDDLGLPVAPTFSPDDRPVKGIFKRQGYTDDDAKNWCTVCLEDATVRCLGCDDDVYCARCWKEMHVGPAAGYDERGHQWEKFVKPK